MSSSKLSLWLAAIIAVVHAQLPEPNGQDFCALSDHAMTKVGDKLYIIGGKMIWGSNSSVYSGPNNYLRTIDTATSFRTSDDFDTYSSTIPIPDQVPRVSRPGWWHTEPEYLSLVLGRPENENKTLWGNQGNVQDTRRWRYNLASGNWTDLASVSSVTTNSDVFDGSSGGVYSIENAWSPELHKGFSLGGNSFTTVTTGTETIQYQDSLPNGGMYIYDVRRNLWTSEGAFFPNYLDSGRNWPIGQGGRLTPLATAEDNVFIRFGGMFNGSWADMGTINIWSNQNFKWLQQDLPNRNPSTPNYNKRPPPRREFCTAIASAPDNSSYQIIIAGGVEQAPGNINNEPGLAATSIWVLNIPTFEWFELANIKSENFNANPQGRIAPTCEIVGGHYLLMYGGRKVVRYVDEPACEPGGNAVYLLDLDTETWTETYQPGGDYQGIPSMRLLEKWDPTGMSTKTEPEGGFSDPALKKVMQLRTPTTSARPTPTKSVWVSPSASAAPENNTGAIVGGVVGGAVLIIGVAAGVILYRRRVRRKRVTGTMVYEGEFDAGLGPAAGGRGSVYVGYDSYRMPQVAKLQPPEYTAVPGTHG